MKIVTVLLALLGALPAYAQDETIGLRLREWYARINGSVFAEAEGIAAGDIDLDQNLGLGQAEFAHEIQAYLSFPVLGKFYAGYWFADYKGERWLGESFTFVDQTFTVGTLVESELELHVGYLTYEFVLPVPMPLGEVASLEVGLLGGVRFVAARGFIDSDFASADKSGVGGLPVIGVHGALQLMGWLRADVEVLGLAFRAAERSASYVEAYAEVVARLGPVFGGVGYKYVGIDIKDKSASTTFEADVTMDGIYLTVGVRF